MTVAPATPSRTPAVRRRHLPGPVQASSALPMAETAAFSAVVPLLSIPLLLTTMAAVPAVVAAVALTSVVAALCLSRRTVVGRDWVADRRLWRFRVTHASALRAVEAVSNGHGGLLKLHPRAARPHRLRAPELDGPAIRSALATVVLGSSAKVSPSARSALGLSTPPPALSPDEVDRDLALAVDAR